MRGQRLQGAGSNGRPKSRVTYVRVMANDGCFRMVGRLVGGVGKK